LKRVLTGIIAAPIVLGIVYFSSPALFMLFVAAITLIGIHEYFTIIDRIGISGFPILAMILGFLLLLSFYFNGDFMLEWGLLASVSLFATWFIQEDNPKIAIDQISFTLFGILYIANALRFLVLPDRAFFGF